AFGQLGGFDQHGELLGAVTHFDLVADLNLVGRNVDALAVDQDMAMRHELARSKHGRHELGAIHDRVQTTLEQADQVLAGVALDAGSFGVEALERLFRNRTIIALQLLLGAELQTIVRELALAALTMLAGAIGTGVERGLRTTPDVFAKTAINFVLG